MAADSKGSALCVCVASWCRGLAAAFSVSVTSLCVAVDGEKGAIVAPAVVYRARKSRKHRILFLGAKASSSLIVLKPL